MSAIRRIYGAAAAGSRADWLGGAALAFALTGALAGGAPLAAQQRQADDDLRALIPDAAVNDPEGWAKAQAVKKPAAKVAPPPASSAVPIAAPAAQDSAPPLNLAALIPDSPMEDIAGLDLPWPEPGKEEATIPIPTALAAQEDGETLAAAMARVPPPGAARLAARNAGDAARPEARERETTLASGRARLVWPADPAAMPEREAFERRFRDLSALQGLGAHDADALAQLVVRGSSDRKLLEKLFKVYGYYDGEVTQSLIGPEPGADGNSAPPTGVRFDMDPGARYHIGAITTGRLEDTGKDAARLRAALAIKTGDPLDQDAIEAGTTQLAKALGEAGYPFAKVPSASLTIDHARDEGDVDVAVEPGGQYRYGAITSALPRVMSPNHLGDIARFKPGQVWNQKDVEDLRRAVLATGLVAGVNVTPRETAPPKDGQPGVVALDVAMSRAPVHTIAGEIGYDTGQGARVGASWENRNLFPPEGALKLRGVLGTNEQLAGATFRRANFLGRDRQLTVDLYATNTTLASYAARKVAFATSYERLTNLLFQKPWTWSMGLEVEASEEREGVPSGVTTGRILYITTALPLRAGIDSTDNLLDPTKGHRASLRISPEQSWARETQSRYARIQADASFYRSLDKVVLATRVRLGTMPGSDIDYIAPSRRFYAGGGASIRGYGYNLVGPRNALGEPKGGRSLYEFSIEARVNTHFFGGALQLVPFLDAGGVEAGTVPKFNDWRYGAGLGIRYRTGFGPIRIDVGTPLNPRAGDSRIGVYVALGQAF
ncbi:autotransporter assembly complex protein TamA [Novosphingobium sp. KACC 22771]|uniref:autotransporter assembly complex protein TamA n=1 Tax=Novosphingobium sp. KACC 22771 TaxID=3025670 RepID=UPI0023655417|nr:BamA/TamA family outer membrane protein [Novosphingobium sp. KACC 22771]WDF72135.1 BamA/TamA family outer membrane protein [Novosphingobium sp. KACC 22771]